MPQEAGALALHTGFLVTRTIISIVIAKLDGTIVKVVVVVVVAVVVVVVLLLLLLLLTMTPSSRPSLSASRTSSGSAYRSGCCWAYLPA